MAIVGKINGVPIEFSESAISHLNINDIGSNTHAQIDTHIADTSIHYTQASITTVGTIATGVWQGTAIADAYIASAATWNAKQDVLSITQVTLADADQTLSASDLVSNKMLVITPTATRTLTTDSAANIIAAASGLAVGNYFDFTIIDTNTTNDLVLAGGTGVTITYGTDIRAGAATFRCRIDSGSTVTIYPLTKHFINTSEITSTMLGSSVVTTGKINAAAVTYAKIQDVAANNVLLGNDNGTGQTVQELSAAEVKTILSLDNVENTALSTWAGTTNITTLGTIATGTWNATTITEIYGGTNQTTYATGDILYASGVNTLSKLSAGTDTHVLTLSGGVPTWAAPTGGSGNVATDTIWDALGDLAVGTGADTAARLAIGTAGQLLTVSGGTAAWVTYAGSTSVTTLGTITTGTWNGTAITGTYIDESTVDHDQLLNFDANEHFTQASITTVGTIGTGTWQGTAIDELYGGTGFTTYATGDILYASAANTLSKLTAGTNGHVLTLSAGVPTWAAATGSTNSFETWTIDNTDTEYTWAGTDGSIVADSATDTVTFVAGTNITLDRDATLDAIRITASGGGASWTKVTKAYTDFTAAATSESITLFTLTAGYILKGIVIKHTTAFAGTGITAYTLEVGISGETDRYSEAFDVFQATADTTFGIYQNFDIQNWGSNTTVQLTARSTGGNLSAGTAGAVEVYYMVEQVKS